ncbi:hypothetical protein [Mesorhizobium sp. Root695]|uniref:hypothetical protein n=1 Tax=Mesorhizobium sp. Root695 TaxID=1736589 RepID=UPI0012E3A2BE|nr:hypothetical protein [Mesorhizobium sp. Root695]
MAFKTGYFVITSKYPDFNSKRTLKLDPFKDYWLVKDQFDIVADIFVFEREDACRRLYPFKTECSQKYGSEASIRFIRSLTRKGAAKCGLRGEGEILEYFRPTYEEAQKYEKLAREAELTRVCEDIEKYRKLLEHTHQKFPKIDRSGIPVRNAENPHTERVYLDRYVCGLARCGAISDNAMKDFRASLRTGYSDHRFTEFADNIAMVPND